MSDSKVEINVPEKLVETVIVAEVAKHLDTSSGIVERVIHTIITEEDKNYYGRGGQTLVVKAFKEMVAETAKGIIAELIEERRPEIRAAVEKQLQTKTFVKKASEAVIAGLEGSKWHVNVSFGVVDKNM